MAEKSFFGTLDIVIFVVTLVLSAAIGIFFAVKDRQKKNVENYFYGGKKMSPIPVGFSIAVSFISAITLIGYPADTYLFGMVTIWYAFTLVAATVVACLYYIPLVHRLQLNTIYEYLGLRFHPIIRKITSTIEIIYMMTYMGLAVYLPALALSAVTPISITTSIIITSVICTSYTTLGGLKAVVWTDNLQAAIMFIGSLSVLIQGTIIVGGPAKVWEANERSGRNNIWTFDLDPTIRTTFWTVMVGMSATLSIPACVHQSACQRYLSCKSVKDARVAACTALIPKIIITLIALLSGCVAYAYFEGCDPLKSKRIAKADQIMPYLALESLHDLPGMSGFFVAAAYSGTLSSVSSGINTIGSMILKDFIIPLNPQLTHGKQLIISKLTALAVGVLVATIAFLATMSSQTIVSIMLSTRGAFGGPLLGIFTLGMFIPWCNAKGAFTGQVAGICFSLWIALGSLINGKDPESLRLLPTSTDNCTASGADYSVAYTNISTSSYQMSSTWSEFTNPTNTPIEVVEKSYNPIQAMSFMYYTLVGFTTTVIVGIVVSACTGFRDPKKMDPKLFLPLIDNSIFPKSVVRFFRFGVPPFVNEVKDYIHEENLVLNSMDNISNEYHDAVISASLGSLDVVPSDNKRE